MVLRMIFNNVSILISEPHKLVGLSQPSVLASYPYPRVAMERGHKNGVYEDLNCSEERFENDYIPSICGAASFDTKIRRDYTMMRQILAF